MVDHWRLSRPMRKFSQPMRSCSCAASMVVGSAEGWNKRAWWEERVAIKQEQMEGCISEDWSQEENLSRAAVKMADIWGPGRRSHARWFQDCGHSMGISHCPTLFA